jgi:hypothetical protein
MDGAASSGAAGHDRRGRFVNGHSEYAARRRRVAQRLQQLCRVAPPALPSSGALIFLLNDKIPIDGRFDVVFRALFVFRGSRIDGWHDGRNDG